MSGDGEDDAPAQSLSSLTAMPYQVQECILYGSILQDKREDLERRLAGLCDPGHVNFQEHEMVFTLKTHANPDVTIRLRRDFNVEQWNSTQLQWHFRYMGGPEPDTKCPVMVRKVIDSIVYSHNMMEFVKTLGLRMDYEYITKGRVYTNGKMKVVLNSQIQRTEKVGNYDASLLKKYSDSCLVEMSVSLAEGQDYTGAAKQLRDFADQLLPLVEMQKVDYWRK